MLIITAPGQGAQTPGFLAPWLEVPGVAERLGAASELAGCDLIRYGTTADADEIRDTAVAQPLLVAAALAAAGALAGGPGGLGASGGPGGLGAPGGPGGPGAPGGPGGLGAAPGDVRADVAAGHSVGELAAGVLAGVLSEDDAMRLVGVRGAAMAAAAAAEPTGMTAVLGGEEETVLAAIARHGLTPANVNGAGQIVAAGAIADLAAFAADPPRGARLRPLQVAGAFHTRYMAPAVAALRDAAAGVAVTDPHLTLLCNADGAAATTGKEWLERIVAQVAAPVRWDLCQQTMADLGVTAIIELPPAGTLTGLARRALPGVAQLALKTPDQLEAAWDLIEEHLSEPDAHGHADLPDWRLIVAPTAGTFRSADARGDAVPTDAIEALTADLGSIVARGGERRVAAPWPAEIIEWLVEDGDPVSEGQPLVRILPPGGLGGWFPPDKREGA
jgi:[acyl-carrier-protein] S-malonyltransferase